MRPRRFLASLVIAASAVAAIGGVAPAALAQGAAVVVNGVALTPDVLMALQTRYQTRIAPGRYWYDQVSGAWGREGGPAEGQIAPGHRLGGPLRADASRGNTGVFVNGRELHIQDVRALQRCTPVMRGRYWVEASGIGGYEGAPPSFNLAALCAAAGGGGRRGGSSTQTECFPNGCQSTNHVTGGGVITDGQGGAAVFIPGGGMVMTPN
jgi:hypothetical protein